ncbi:hypothetical protein B0T14DRAFT_559155 [Immersiella caudata]|uniref:Uncharacterized protein n=1 Tax=Immersiella caudata TaxID=314043 RepID=A0AA39XCV1_9PEZI|nr:hypothetical protein B0T14DRAFT_559155 [Immersiella caudata]
MSAGGLLALLAEKRSEEGQPDSIKVHKPFAFEQHPRYPPSPDPPRPLLQRITRTSTSDAAPKASFIECPLFPANRPLGFPHLIDTRTFTEDTDLRSFRFVDVVATIFYKYNTVFCELFFEEAYQDIVFYLTDLRVHNEPPLPTWTVAKAVDNIKVEFVPGAYQFLGYSAEVKRGDCWDPVEITDIGDVDYVSLRDDEMELYGSYIGKRMLCPQPFIRTPYFAYKICVNGQRVHPDWPKEDLGANHRARAVGLVRQNQDANLGLVRQVVVSRTNHPKVVDGPKNREDWGHPWYSLN